MRKNYSLKVLDENHIKRSPIEQFRIWLEEACEVKAIEPTAMVLATATSDGIPSIRVVLLKDYSINGFVFFTNYSGRKGREIELNPKVALLFHWPELERQVRIEGVASKTSASVSDEYFNSRPLESRLSAMISRQSEAVHDREYLEKLWREKQIESIGKNLARPSFWGGYIVEPINFEFWQGRSNRLHDRIIFLKKGTEWVISRLAP